MVTRIRVVFAVVVAASLGGCALLASSDRPGQETRPPPVPEPDPTLAGELPTEAFEIAGRVGDLITGDDPWDPDTLLPVFQRDPSRALPGATETHADEAPQAVAECPRMPTAGLARRRAVFAPDWDSLRALPPEVRDSMLAAGDVPRTNERLIPFGDASVGTSPNSRMPVVRLDSAGYPIRVVPLCRVVGTGR